MAIGRIFLREMDGTLVPMDETPYDSEGFLQDQLASHPDLLAGYQIDEESPRRWLFVRREHAIAGEEGGTGRWAVDHVFLDQDAIPTLVEVKRRSDTRLRREVVGQLLEYAANATSYWPPQELRIAFEARCKLEHDRLHPEEVLAASLGEELDSVTFWSDVEQNLRAGRVRLLFVADVIPPELQRIVEFLNEQMDPAEVLALEIRQFTGGERTALVPRVLGNTMTARDRKRRGGAGRIEPWDVQDFLARMKAEAGEDKVEVARALLAWAYGQGLEVKGGRGDQKPGLNLGLTEGGQSRNVLRVAAPKGRALLRLNFRQMGPGFEQGGPHRAKLSAMLEAIPGAEIPPGANAPAFPLELFRAADDRRALEEALNWAMTRARASAGKDDTT